jgi:protein phosphatase
MKLQIPEFALVMVIGTSGSGKSTFCRKHFLPTQVLSSDAFRGYVSDDEDSLDATADAFEALHAMLAIRLRAGRLTVVDATNVQPESRRPLLQIASNFHALKVAIVLDVPVETCRQRNLNRSNRQFGSHVLRNQRKDLDRSLGLLRKERFHKVYVLSPEQVDTAEIAYERLWSRRPEETGPFHIIGDVHGCSAELDELLALLGKDRKLIFLGDLVDRGPDSVGVLRRVMELVSEGQALCVPGNHDIRLARALAGKDVSKSHGLAETLAALEGESAEFREQVRTFIEGLVSHLVLDEGRLCVAHAGMRADMQGRGSPAVREFALYGETTGEIDEFGLPVRYPWAREYRGSAAVVYGHTPVPTPEWLNNTIDIDTGCCFGGQLTALRWPERENVSVEAHRVYCEPVRPVSTASTASDDALLSVEDVLGRRSVETRLAKRITISEWNATAALETMSRFAVSPNWLITLPPTMSPSHASDREGFLEYPTEAFDAYRSAGITRVICQEKHMGSRALVTLCRDETVAKARFGDSHGSIGMAITRTGRAFFDEPRQTQFLQRLRDAADRSGLFDALQSDWVLLDAEIMPWSAKAEGLLRRQYAPVGAAALAQSEWLERIESDLKERGIQESVDAAAKRHAADRFIQAYRRYCRKVQSLDDYRFAPFHVLASEGAVHLDRPHLWHLATAGMLADADPICMRTAFVEVELGKEDSVGAACAWWEALVSAGGEGMVVKPEVFLAGSPREVQPAIKCRGPEYLRIIYGPEYLHEANLKRLRRRGLGRKQSLATREFALGIEALERFVRREPLRRVHECVFAILALESDPVDPRL